MPCRSDYMEPTQTEIEQNKLIDLLAYVKDGTAIPSTYGSGYGEAYCHQSDEAVNEMTKELCSIMRTTSQIAIKRMPLEVQTWWRDHQLADKRHEKEDKNKIK